MFTKLSSEPEEFQALFKRIMNYHFDWSPQEPTQKARAKQTRAWIEESVAKSTKKPEVANAD